jgi:hypothetical protein
MENVSKKEIALGDLAEDIWRSKVKEESLVAVLWQKKEGALSEGFLLFLGRDRPVLCPSQVGPSDL